MPQPFFKPAAGTFDATGTAEVTVSPPGGVDWHVRITSVSSTSTAQPTATLTLDGHFLEGTYSGNRDTSDTVYTIPAGSQLVCTWTGGTAGARATLSLRGLQTKVGDAA